MKSFIRLLVFAGIIVLASSFNASEKANGKACWGQASAVFAQMGYMGEHSSDQVSPRLGLRNLARALHEAGILPDDSMQALGVFVSDELGLDISACTN
jgi:hypothetical protein